VRYSEKEMFNQCPYKYRLAKVEGLAIRDDEKSQHHLKWGQGIHAGLEAHYKGLPFSEVEAAFRKEYPENLDPEDLAKTVANGVEVLRQYIAFYSVQDQFWEVVGTEVLGQVEIGGNDADLHIDMIARHRQSGELYFWDHKTSGKEPGALYWKSYELSGQLTRYTAYLQEKFGECSGAWINGIFVKWLKIKNKYGEGPGLVVKFQRQMFNRTPQQVAFWRESDEGWMRMIAQAERDNNWPRALNTLCAYCEFYDLCLASGDQQVKEMLYQLKETKDFNPVVPTKEA
jgi:hypothetical protein